MSDIPAGLESLNAFIDAELELTRQLELEARLATDSGLRDTVRQLRDLGEAVRNHADYHGAPPALRLRLQRPVAAANAARAPTGGWHRWFAWRPVLPALLLAGLLAAGVELALRQADQDERLMQQVVASHVRSTVGERGIDVASSDQHTVKPWLSARLDFSPPVVDVTLPGASLAGGRVDYIDGRPAAALVYRLRKHVIDVYIWPSALPDATPADRSLRGFNSVHWVHGGMRYWVVSDLNPAELAAFAQALFRADGSR